MGIAPVVAWCKEAWRREGQRGPMRLAWQHAAKVMQSAKRPWSLATGPATSTWASLCRLGWAFPQPFVFEDGKGTRYDVLDSSPVKLRKLLIKAARDWTTQAGLRSAGLTEAVKETDRIEWDWVRKVLHGRHGGTAEERGGVRATIDGSVWTESRLWMAGYRDQQTCACGHEVGNTPHRILRCPLHDEDREGLSKRWLEGVGSMLGDKVMEGRVLRLLPFRRNALPPPPAESDTVIQEVRWAASHRTGYNQMSEWDEEGVAALDKATIGEEEVMLLDEFSPEVRLECRQWRVRNSQTGLVPEDPFEGWVSTDGSVVDGNGHYLGRAGAAVVQLGGSASKEEVMGWVKEPESNPFEVRALCCSMGGCRLTSGDGELFAFEVLMERAVPPLVLFTDYKGIVDGLAMGRAWCTAGDKTQADRWKRIWDRLEKWPRNSLLAKHFNSHQDIADITEAKERIVWLGNWVADGVAKAAAGRWRVGKEILEGYQKDWKDYRALTRLGGRVMVRSAGERPWAKEGKRWKGFQEDRGLREKGPQHYLFKIGRRTRCAFCPQYADTSASLRRMRWLSCRGAIEDRITGLGHTLARSCDVVGGSTGLLWCVKCGMYAEASTRGLAQACKGVATRAGKRNISLLEKGWHPRGLRKLHAPQPVAEGDGEESGRVVQPPEDAAEAEEGSTQGGVTEDGRAGIGVGGGEATESGGEAGLEVSGRDARAAGQGGGVEEDRREVALEVRTEGRPNVWSMDGVTIGTNVPGPVIRSGATKRSRFRI